MSEQERASRSQGRASGDGSATPSQAGPAPAETPPSDGVSAPAQKDAKEIEEGKVFAVLSYALNFVYVPFFVIPLILRNNSFSLYHAKQCLMIWLAGAVLCAIILPMRIVLPDTILRSIALAFAVALNIIGLISAVKEEQKPVPVIGKWAEDWFKGLRKA